MKKSIYIILFVVAAMTMSFTYTVTKEAEIPPTVSAGEVFQKDGKSFQMFTLKSSNGQLTKEVELSKINLVDWCLWNVDLSGGGRNPCSSGTQYTYDSCNGTYLCCWQQGCYNTDAPY